MAKFTKLNVGDSVASSGERAWKKLSVESAEVQDELAGTWVFNDIPTGNVDFESWYVDFTSNGLTFAEISYELRPVGIWMYYSGTQVLSGGSLIDFTSWVSSAYKTITITSNLSDVTNGSTLLTWLKANAMKQGASSLITFTIAGTSYQAEEGMTWGEWVASKYNTNGVKIDSAGNVLTSTGLKIATAKYSGNQYSTDTIVANTSYVIKSSGGAD